MKRFLKLVGATLLASAILAPPVVAISDSATWCASFKGASLTVQLPAGYWSTASHTFSYHAEIPAAYTFDGNLFTEDGTFSFVVDPEAQLYPGKALLYYDVNGDGKPVMLYGSKMVDAINPGQPTVLFGFFGWEYRHWYTADQMATEYAHLTMAFTWDQNGSSWVDAAKGPLVSMCVYGPNVPFTGQFLRTWGHS